jgi:hypothetical protein
MPLMAGFPTLEFLGSASIASASTNMGTLTIPAKDVLMIVLKISGYGGNDIAAFRFNGDAGANYWDRHLTSSTGAAVWTNVQRASTTSAQVAGVAQTNGRIVTMFGINKASVAKHFNLNTGDITGAAATVGRLDYGAFEWVNTTAQITQIFVNTVAGQNLSADTEYGVWGRNL